VSLDSALWVAGIGTEIAVVAVLIHKGLFRLFPVFSLYLVWAVVNDSAMMAIGRMIPGHYLQAFLIETSLDSVLQFCVLVELAWSVLRPLRDSLSRWAIAIPAVLILAVGAAVWPLAGTLSRPGYSAQWHLLFQLQQSFSIVRILVFLVLAGLSQLLGIGWKDRELQIATGLGLYSLVSLGAAAMHTHPASPGFYHAVDQVVMVSYLCSLFYWVASFVQKQAPRQEFSPRMQNLLLTVAGTARAGRLVMADRKSKL
jgi:hypothetical protein